MRLDENKLNHLYPVLFGLLIATSILFGFWRIVAMQDFVIFTSEEDIPSYMVSTSESDEE